MRTLRSVRRPKPSGGASRWLILSLAAGFGTSAQAQDAYPQNAATSSALTLEVELNGRPTHLIAQFFPVGGDFAVSTDDLREFGFDPEKLPPADDGRIALGALKSSSFRYDEASQRMLIWTSPSLLSLTRVSPRARPASAQLSRATIGAVLNYAVTASAATGGEGKRGGFEQGAAQFDARIFGGFGLVSSSFITNASAEGDVSAKRLDTWWALEDPERLTTLRVGDLITHGLSWTRPIRAAGVQFSRSFDLRPDLLTMALPSLRGTAQAPSTLDLFVGGQRILSSTIPAGPFEVSPGPAVSGAGVAEVVVRDLLGREARLELPFYASDQLLARELLDFAVDIGFPRRNFGVRSNDYDPRLTASGTVRYGLTNGLTAQAHAELAGTLVNVGAGAVFTIGELAVGSFAVTGSSADGRTGASIDVGFESHRGAFTFRARSARVFGAYQDLASLTARPPGASADELAAFGAPKAIDQAQLSAQFWLAGPQFSVSAARVARRDDEARIVSFSISQAVGMGTLYARGWQDFSNKQNGVSLGLALPFGGQLFGSSQVTADDAGVSAVQEVASRPSAEVDSLSWRARIAQGRDREASASAAYLASFGRFEAGAQRVAGQSRAFVQGAGSIAFTERGLFASRRIDNAFAVVDVGAPDIPIRYENRPAGKTGKSGRLLVPNLVAYQPNHIAIDARYLPLDQEVSEDSFLVVPRRGGGATVRVATASSVGTALVTFVSSSGQPIAVGTAGRLQQATEGFVVGYDGQAYVHGLSATNSAVLRGADGELCTANFRYSREQGSQARIGPVVCQTAIYAAR